MYKKTIPHPLKEELRQRKIRLWMVRDLSQIAESQLSRYLNGIDPMPRWLEQLLWQLVKISTPSHNIDLSLNSQIDEKDHGDED